MKVKTSELIGPALDWAVAKDFNLNYRIKERDDLSKHIVILSPVPCPDNKPGCAVAHFKYNYYSPSTDWTQGGPLIERENICLIAPYRSMKLWDAYKMELDTDLPCYEESGPTPLITAMRCLVASRLGDEVEIPGELCK